MNLSICLKGENAKLERPVVIEPVLGVVESLCLGVKVKIPGWDPWKSFQ